MNENIKDISECAILSVNDESGDARANSQGDFKESVFFFETLKVSLA